MKSVISILSCFLLLSCNFATVPQQQEKIPYQQNGLVKYLRSEGAAQYFESINIGSTSADAVYNCTVSVIENLLFKGIPSSPSETPLIQNERTAYDKHGEILKQIIFDTAPNKFVTYSAIMQEEKIPDGVRIILEVAIDTKALRRELEKQAIISKLGL